MIGTGLFVNPVNVLDHFGPLTLSKPDSLSDYVLCNIILENQNLSALISNTFGWLFRILCHDFTQFQCTGGSVSFGDRAVSIIGH